MLVRQSVADYRTCVVHDKLSEVDREESLASTLTAIWSFEKY